MLYFLSLLSVIAYLLPRDLKNLVLKIGSILGGRIHVEDLKDLEDYWSAGHHLLIILLLLEWRCWKGIVCDR